MPFSSQTYRDGQKEWDGIWLLQIVWDSSNLFFFLFTQAVYNSLRIGNYIRDVPKLFKIVLEMVLRLILSAYPCIVYI